MNWEKVVSQDPYELRLADMRIAAQNIYMSLIWCLWYVLCMLNACIFVYFPLKAKKQDQKFVRDAYACSKEMRRKIDIFDYNKFSVHN